MKRSFIPFVLLAACRIAIAAPLGLDTTAPLALRGPAREDYIILIDKDDSLPDHVEDVLHRISLASSHTDVRHTYNNDAFRGFAASLTPRMADNLRAMTDVRLVEKSVTLSLTDSRVGAPWGLERISTANAVSGDEHTIDFTYSFQDSRLGQGADIYVVDTGIRTDHRVFEGRARMGYSFDPNNISDEEGHGTHVSGTAGGDWVGVSDGANIIGVKVLGADGQGNAADTIKGIDYVLQEHSRRKTEADFAGSIISMSLGLSDTFQPLDEAVQLATQQGVHVVVAAGNSGSDTCAFSPSRNGGTTSNVIAVGSVGISNAISSFSNTGPCTDVYAPGEQVLSSWNASPNTLKFLDGTSMATPHVTGILAYLMVEDPSLAQDPAAMKTRLHDLSISGLIFGSTVDNAEALLATNGDVAQDQPFRRQANNLREGLKRLSRRGLRGKLSLPDRKRPDSAPVDFDIWSNDGEGPR